MKSQIINQAQTIIGYRRWYVMMSLVNGYHELRLADHFGVSKPTIQRDMSILKEWYGVTSARDLGIIALAIEQLNIATVFDLDIPKLKSAE